MPAYNAEKYIAASIESVISQTHADWELLIVDDGSTDSTKQIINRYKDKDNRITYYYQDNSGQAKARNYGLEVAGFEFVSFIDSDDLWLPEMLEVSIKEFEQGDQDVLFSNSYVFDDGGDPYNLTNHTHLGINNERYEGNSGIKRFVKQNRISMDGILSTRKVLLKTGGFRDKTKGLAEDYELWLNLLSSGIVFRGFDKKLSLVRKHSMSTMATNNIYIGVIEMFERFFSVHQDLVPLCRNEISDWLGLNLSLAKNKNDIFKVYNKKNLSCFLFGTTIIDIITIFRRVIPEKVIKKILYIYLSYYDKKQNKSNWFS